MLPAPEVQAKVDHAFDDIMTAALKWTPSKEADVAQVKPYPARRMKFKGDIYALNQMFQNRKWSLNLPVIPPTPDRVAEMLKGTKRDPAEVVWVVPPRQGILTVELVAAYGVMAGAKPEHMPLLLATIEAFKHPDVSWRGTSTTTAYTVPVIILSGPIIQKFGLNFGTGTAGPGNPVTNSLGYFINLIGDVIGGSIVPNFDKSTHGGSGDFVATVF
ncbi:MAG: thiol-disulfide oxidoreductase, partial [Desulfovibrio sp.]|nr:thiol-disulfide oxidoreductase [Desulfovibrio sp.]